MALSFDYESEPEEPEEFEVSWEQVILQWLHQLEELESPDEVEALEEVV
jgi:hypothetical protein